MALSLALLGACAASCNRRSSPGPVREVRLGYFANVTHAQAILGACSGDFARAIAPVELKTQVFNAGPSLIEALLAGDIDVAYVGPGPALNAHAKTRGKGLRVIAAAASNGVLIVARDGSGIKTLADLKDRRLATPQQGNTQDISARHYLRFVLKQPDTSNVVPISNAEQAGMMSRGQIDAAWAPEPWGSFLVAQAGGHIIGREQDLWPDKQFTLTVVVTTPEYLANHPDVVEKLLQVHRIWTGRLKQDPGRYTAQLDAALFALTSKRLSGGVLPAAMANVKYTDEPLIGTFESLADWSHQLGFDSQQVSLNGLFDTSILRKLEQAAASQPADSGSSGKADSPKEAHAGHDSTSG
jgi:NitT/TauT family transport system substrate-binding protein